MFDENLRTSLVLVRRNHRIVGDEIVEGVIDTQEDSTPCFITEADEADAFEYLACLVVVTLSLI